ncbi:MAG: winged helix-turn-helix domain-containing protein [Myxococcota bacterium]
MRVPTLLLVEDDTALAGVVREYLRGHGFEVHVEGRGDRAAQAVRDVQPDLVILDLGLPGADGLSVCREIRAWYDKPILILTARGDATDQIVGLELGADDYIAKPVPPRLLLARVRSALRRQHAAPPASPVRVGELIVDPQSRSVTMRGQSVPLSTAEFDLLHVLARHAGRPLSREELVGEVRGVAYNGQDRSIDLRISRIRKKLGDDPREPALIKSVRGVGYLLAVSR